MDRCSITLLGSMRVTLDGSQLQGLESVKVRALLAYLAVESGQPQEREHLADLFWPERSEAHARQRLSQSIYNLRLALGEAGKTAPLSVEASRDAPFILVTPHTVQFNPLSDHWVDVKEFEQRILQVRQHSHRRLETCEQCAELLVEAEQLYQADFLSGLSLSGCQTFEEWTLVWREKLRRQLCEALSDLTTCYEGHGELRRGLDAAQRWALLDPLSEPAQRKLMHLLALDGQRTQALARYSDFQRLLKNELGVEPGAETRQLYERIQVEETTQIGLPDMAGTLPLPLTPFIGRENELSELSAWLCERSMRLITILGPGGSGKTRLALQVASGLGLDYPDGLFLVSLSGIGSSEAFLPALTNALGVVVQPNPTWGNPFEQLLGYLQNRQLLLILDSFEEVPAAAQQVTRMLQVAPKLQILVTSRARLNVQSEQVFPLEGLPYPKPTDLEGNSLELGDYAALKLFHTSARQVRPDYSHTPTDLPYVSRICQMVDGMPLGLILAAGWLGTCSPQEIAAEIESSLDFLSSGWSDVPERQRSLRATLDYSWHLLEDDERQAFQKLSIFQSPFTRPAAEQVAGIGMTVLRRLVDKCILQIAGGHYRMHDLVRQYAAEKLAEDELAAGRVRDAHSAYYLARVIECETHLKSAQRSATLRALDAEINDVQAAWNWACSQANIAWLAESLEGLGLYYEMRLRYPEMRAAFQRGLDIVEKRPPAVREGLTTESAVLHARLLVWLASTPFNLAEIEAARRLHQAAGELLDRLEAQGLDVRRARAMYWKAEGDSQLADRKFQLDCYQRAIALYEQLDDLWRLAGTLHMAVEAAIQLGNVSLGKQYCEEALRLARQVGEPNRIVDLLHDLGFLYFHLLQFEAIGQLIKELAAFGESLEEPQIRANAEFYLGRLLFYYGLFPETLSTLERALPQLRSLGYRWGAAFCNYYVGVDRCMLGDYAHAEAIFLALIQEAEQGPWPRLVAAGEVLTGYVMSLQGRAEQAVEHLREGARRYRELKHAAEMGMALGGLAIALEATGQPQAAKEALLEALYVPDNAHTLLGSLPAVMILLAHRGHIEAALQVHRVALKQPGYKNSRSYADLIGAELDAEWKKLPEDRQAAIDASISQHNVYSIIHEVRPLLEASQ